MSQHLVFLSYSRRDRSVVTDLHNDLTNADYEVWFDRELTGGQLWWDEILHRIRSCDIFVFALSPDSVKSKACRAELDYASELNRPILPLLLREVNIELAPDPISQLEYVDYRQRTPENAIRLLKTVARMRRQDVPMALPVAPPPPVTNLGPLRNRLGAESLTFRDQQDLVLEFQRHIEDVDAHPTLSALLEEFRSRPDIVRSVSHDVEILIDQIHFRSSTAGESSRDLIRAILSHLEGGHVTPITGTGLTDSLIGSRRQIAHDFAQSFDFPMSRHQSEDLPQVAQFVTVMTNNETLRSELAEHIRNQLLSHFDGEFHGSLDDLFVATWHRVRSQLQWDAHSVVAGLASPIFITGHPVSLLGAALREAGKDPVEEVCRWRTDVYEWPQSVFETEPDYVPSIQRPLVFHVFGHLDVPESLVITEDDFFEFMIGVAQNKSAIPSPVRAAVADSSLLLLGFGLQDHDVRVLLRSLVGQEGGGRLHRYTHVAAQVDLSNEVISPLRARKYLERYFGRYRQPAIDIYWGTVDEFTADLGKERERAQ
jgi:TIR domain/SIR2-like domain